MISLFFHFIKVPNFEHYDHCYSYALKQHLTFLSLDKKQGRFNYFCQRFKGYRCESGIPLYKCPLKGIIVVLANVVTK